MRKLFTILTLTVTCIVIAMFSSMVFLYQEATDSLSQAILERQSTVASVTARQIETRFDNLRTLLQVQTKVRSLIRTVSDATVFEAKNANLTTAATYLDDLYISSGGVGAFSLLDREGRVLYSNNPATRNAVMADRSFFREAIQGVVSNSVPQVSRISGQPLVMMAAGIPYEGEYQGVIVLAVNINEVANSTVGNMPLGSSTQIMVVDGDGMVLMHSNPVHNMRLNLGNESWLKELLTNRNVTHTITWNQQDYIATIHPVSYSGWSVLVLTETDTAFLPIRQLLTDVLAVTLVGLLLVLILAVWVFRRQFVLMTNATNLTKAIFTATESLYMVGNGYGKIIDSSEAVARFFGAPDRTTFEDKWKSYLLEEQDGLTVDALVERVKSTARTTGKVTFEALARDHHGAPIPVESTAVPISFNGAPAFFLLIRDMRPTKANEAMLREARDAAEAANRIKSEFLANMSHEIRTPMNAIIGMTYLALQTELTAQQRDYLSKIDDGAKTLLRIINDILDFSKIEAGRLDIEQIEFQIESVFTHLAGLVTGQAEKKSLEVVFQMDPDTPPILTGDPLRLGQVLLNLTSNAVKFTEKGEVTVSVRPLENDGTSVTLEFTVSDTGMGMTPEQTSRLFRAFSQADASITRKYGGSGLGLSISKALVELMGGHITVKSIWKNGSTFTFTVRCGIASSREVVPLMPQVDMKNMHALVVDDNASARLVMRDLLERMGFFVDEAESGPHAITMASPLGQTYHFVFMDWKMPEMDGIETSRRLMVMPSCEQARFIMVTAFGQEGIRRLLDGLPICSVLEKPVAPSNLFNAIVQCIGSRPMPLAESEPAPLEKITLNGHVLLAEDNMINQQIAMELIQSLGLTTDVANNGVEAVAMATNPQNRYDLILMDIQMPEMDGLEATRRIRAHERAVGLTEVPIIAMTAHAMSSDHEKSFEAGMNGHFTKPIDPDKLYETLYLWLKR